MAQERRPGGAALPPVGKKCRCQFDARPGRNYRGYGILPRRVSGRRSSLPFVVVLLLSCTG